MTVNSNKPKSLLKTFAFLTIALSLTSALPSWAQTKGQIPESDAQRAARLDQIQQQQQQQQQDDAVRNAGKEVGELQSRINQEMAEREKLRQMARDNFRRHYEILRVDTDTLVQLTSDLQSSVQEIRTPALPAEMMVNVEKIQKLAHELRSNIVGGRVHKVKAIKGADVAILNQNPALTERKLLLARVSASRDLAASLKNSMDLHLFGDNTQTVSVSALQKSADKDQFGPELASIMATALKLERIAAAIRANPGSAQMAAISK